MGYLMDKEAIGKRIQKLRKERGYTQKELQEEMSLSDRKSISNYEKGKTEIPMTRLPDLCVALDCDLDYIFGKIDIPQNSTKNVMEETGLTEKASRLLLDKKYTDVLNALLIDENFKKMLDVIIEWSEADLNNTHGEVIKYNIKNKLNANINYPKEIAKVLSRISKDGVPVLYRPIAKEYANKMFDTVTNTMYEEATKWQIFKNAETKTGN